MAEQMQGCSFTSRYPGISNRLINRATIINPLSQEQKFEVDALWDTGATNTCISHAAVQMLDLKPNGWFNLQTPTGEESRPAYDIDLYLPNNSIIRHVHVAETEIGNQKIDLLIGMDIITKGDFAVSNHHGRTTFTFRMPSQKETSYYDIMLAKNAIGQHHGRGKRKRKR